MNNDPLKKYIAEHREQFDHLEPDEAVFNRIKATLNIPAVQPKKNIRLYNRTRWMIAASLLILIPAAYIGFHNDLSVSKTVSPKVAVTKSDITEPERIADVSSPAGELVTTTAKAPIRKIKRTHTKQSLPDMGKIYTDLTDSTSASRRLAAILEIEKSNLMSYDLIHRLSETLNNDANSNVRLAALNVMSRYLQDSEVMNACILSLDQQTDPTLQLALILLLRQTSHPKLDDTLYALANDPATFSVVKNQAYLTLLDQNKL